jgi:four helix bundle protein
MRNFKQYEIWQRARIIVKEVYLLSSALPDTEKFGLKSQLQRAAVSILANISEGAGRRTEHDFRHFLYISIASSYEVETLLLLCEDLGYMTNEKILPILNSLEILQKQINLFIQKLSQPPKAKSQQPTTNRQQPKANRQQPTANSQQPTTKSQSPTAKSQKPKANR